MPSVDRVAVQTKRKVRRVLDSAMCKVTTNPQQLTTLSTVQMQDGAAKNRSPLAPEATRADNVRAERQLVAEYSNALYHGRGPTLKAPLLPFDQMSC